MRCWNTRIMVIMTFVGTLLFGMGLAQAGNTAKVKVAVIHATKAKAPKDPALKKIEKSLKTAFGGYKSFKQLDKQVLKLTAGKPANIKLPGAQKARLTYKGKKGKRHMMTLAIPKSKVNVDLRVPARKLFYQAGIPYKNGILILAFYLKEKK